MAEVPDLGEPDTNAIFISIDLLIASDYWIFFVKTIYFHIKIRSQIFQYLL